MEKKTDGLIARSDAVWAGAASGRKEKVRREGGRGEEGMVVVGGEEELSEKKWRAGDKRRDGSVGNWHGLSRIGRKLAQNWHGQEGFQPHTPTCQYWHLLARAGMAGTCWHRLA